MKEIFQRGSNWRGGPQEKKSACEEVTFILFLYAQRLQSKRQEPTHTASFI